MKITYQDAVSELKRELATRKNFYKQQIESGKLDRMQANKQYLSLELALELLTCEHYNLSYKALVLKLGKERALEIVEELQEWEFDCFLLTDYEKNKEVEPEEITEKEEIL